jgi:hypothetical protein
MHYFDLTKDVRLIQVWDEMMEYRASPVMNLLDWLDAKFGENDRSKLCEITANVDGKIIVVNSCNKTFFDLVNEIDSEKKTKCISLYRSIENDQFYFLITVIFRTIDEYRFEITHSVSLGIEDQLLATEFKLAQPHV